VTISYLIWGSWFAAFAVLELLAVFNVVPWDTLSSTVWDLIQRTNGTAAIAVVAGLAVLAVHLVAPSVFERAKKKETP
jgi:uncharacterized metal-binding protein